MSAAKKQRRSKKDNNTPNTSLKLYDISPLTANQKLTFREYFNDQHLFLHGVAGTGKTFIALFLALKEVMSGLSTHNKVIVVRSAVPSRDVGFLPGSLKEKIKEFETPYMTICSDLFGRGDAYGLLKGKGMLEFSSTSYVRGLTLRDSIIILDEIQNYTFAEAASVLTRVGENCRVIVAGDFRQTDLIGKQKDGLHKLIDVIKRMESFSFIEFGVDDIVRSKFVKEFLIACINNEDETCLNSTSASHKPIFAM